VASAKAMLLSIMDHPHKSFALLSSACASTLHSTLHLDLPNLSTCASNLHDVLPKDLRVCAMDVLAMDVLAMVVLALGTPHFVLVMGSHSLDDIVPTPTVGLSSLCGWIAVGLMPRLEPTSSKQLLHC
jgi:hypothetical protein